MSYNLEVIFDKNTYTLTYIVFDEQTKDAIIIDPVLDYDQYISKISYESTQRVLNLVEKNNLNVYYILETHAHADHMSGANEIQKTLQNAKIGINENIKKVQKVFGSVFNLQDFKSDGSQFDILLNEENILTAGSIKIETLFTPGHTPACSSFIIGNMVFTGDALFMPDFGTGRCDFPDGSAKELYNSVFNKLYKLPSETIVYTGHDYQPGGRELRYKSSIGENKKDNIHIQENTTEEEFVTFRVKRDKSLSAPKLLLPSIQININAGKLPSLDEKNMHFLKLPIKR